jgi:hypothetical protein
MSSVTTFAQSKPDGFDDLYLLRDDLARSYGPANAHERMLVTNTAECWLRLARARDAERRFFEGRDVLAIIDAELQKFKIITQYVNDCERAWRASVRELERTQKRRFEAAGLGGRCAAEVHAACVPGRQLGSGARPAAGRYDRPAAPRVIPDRRRDPQGRGATANKRERVGPDEAFRTNRRGL